MCGKNRNDKIINERNREHLKGALIGNNIRETPFILFAFRAGTLTSQGPLNSMEPGSVGLAMAIKHMG